uniref:Interleukin-6 n=1 Tax=Sphaeramia orbicularis TaxID=375764 RepID=A0A672YEY0_9TELE
MHCLLYTDWPWLCVLMLWTLVLRVPGAPLEQMPTDGPTGDPSGEGEEVGGSSDLLSESRDLKLILDATDLHKDEFKKEFLGVMQYHLLDNYRISSLPQNCPRSNFSMEDCLLRLVDGLRVYRVLLKHVEKEYPSSSVLSRVKVSINPLIEKVTEKMKRPDRATMLTSSQEEQLLKELNNLDSFHRKMVAHNILRKLHQFLRSAQLSIRKKEMAKGLEHPLLKVILSIYT